MTEADEIYARNAANLTPQPAPPMITPEMIERAARGLARLQVLSNIRGADGKHSADDIERYVSAGWMTFERQAKAALTAALGDTHVVVPIEPPRGLLVSMALRADHGLFAPSQFDGVSTARKLAAALSSARQQHEEVVGKGFWSPERDASYSASADDAQMALGGGDAQTAPKAPIAEQDQELGVMLSNAPVATCAKNAQVGQPTPTEKGGEG